MAMAKVVEKAPPGPLTEEFKSVIKEIKIGASRAEALRNMAYRIDSISMTSFTATLIAADSVGASIGPILKIFQLRLGKKEALRLKRKEQLLQLKFYFQ